MPKSLRLIVHVLAAGFLALTVGAGFSPPSPDGELPVRLSRISERVVAARVGDFAWSNQTIAVASQKGIVVIDSFSSWAYQDRIRAALEKEFGRSDFIALINTHQHYDHTNGNQIYARLPI